MWCQQNWQTCRNSLVSDRATDWDRDPYLVTARAWLEVEIGYIHLLETKRALCVILQTEQKSKIRLHTENTLESVRTASSSLQYASCTPARTCDFDWGRAWVACMAGAGKGELV